MLIAVFFFGGAWLNFHRLKQKEKVYNSEQTYSAVLMNDPIKHGKIVSTQLLVRDGMYKNEKIQASILRDTIENHYKWLKLGSVIKINSTIRTLEENNITFLPEYKKYLQSKGIVATTFISYTQWKPARNSLKRLSIVNQLKIRALWVRNELLKEYERYTSYTDAVAVIDAMTLGEKAYLSPEIKNIYSSTGASHLLALSGLHLGILFMLCNFLMKKLYNPILEGIISILLIWLYTFITGLSVTILRAAIMLTIFIFARIMKRRPISLNALCLTAFILLLINPFSLWNIGFQLSCIAVLSLVLLYKPIFHFFLLLPISKWKTGKYFFELVAASFVAQIGVAPLLMHYFGTFPPYFLITNIVAIPLSTSILFLSIPIYLSGFAPWPQDELVKLEILQTKLLNYFLEIITRLPMSQVIEIHFSFTHILLYYTILICVCKIIHYIIKVDRAVINHFNSKTKLR